MNLSPHFTLSEFVTSQTAARRGLDNTPGAAAITALRRTALGLEMVRAMLGTPIIISSGYRSQAVNAAVGGVASSQHTRGEAADFTSPKFGGPADIVRAIAAHPEIPYDQLILEFNSWCHISFCAKPRRQALIIDHQGTRQWMPF